MQHLFLWERSNSTSGEHEHEHTDTESVWSTATASSWRRWVVWSSAEARNDFGRSFALWLDDTGTNSSSSTSTGRRAVWYYDDNDGAETDVLFRRRRRRRGGDDNGSRRRIVWLECGNNNNNGSSTRTGRRRFVWIPASATTAGRRSGWTFRIDDDWDWIVWGRGLISGAGGDEVSRGRPLFFSPLF